MEGESDCHTLWFNGYHAYGLPGATNYKPERDDTILAQYERIYVFIEKDSGGSALFNRLAGRDGRHKPSAVLGKMYFTSLEGYKDPSDLWTRTDANPQIFRETMEHAIACARPAANFAMPSGTAPDGQQPVAGAPAMPGEPPAEPVPETRGRQQADYAGLCAEYFTTTLDANGVTTLRRCRDAWYRHNGRCYQQLPDSAAESAMMAFLQRQDVQRRYHVQCTVNARRNLAANLASDTYCALPSTLKNGTWISSGEAAPDWIATESRIVDVKRAAEAHYQAAKAGRKVTEEDAAAFSVELTPDLFSTIAMDYPYDPAAECPLFMSWLKSTQPEPEMQRVLQMMMGLALVPDTSRQVCFFLYGDGGCGKSTFLELLKALVTRDNCCNVGLLELEGSFHTWPLAEKLLNIVDELPTDDPQGRLRYVEGKFKSTVSGGDVMVERKGQDIYPAPCIARHIFATNLMPTFYDKSRGIWDRLRIIPFTNRFRGSSCEVADIHKAIIATELPGMLNFALEGLGMLRAEVPAGFPEPPQCLKYKQQHQSQCDIDGQYCREYYAKGDGYSVNVTDAYRHFCEYLAANGLNRRSAPTFLAAMVRVFGCTIGPLSIADRTRVFRNIHPTGCDIPCHRPEHDSLANEVKSEDLPF